MNTQQGMKAPGRGTDKSRKFASDVIWAGIAQLFSSVIAGIVTLPILTKSYGSEIYGIWSQMQVTVTLSQPLLTLQLGSAVVRFLSGEEDKAKRRVFLGSTLSTVIVVSCLVLITANLLTPQISIFLFGSPDYTLYVRLTCLWIFVSALFSFFIAYLRARNKIRLLSIRQVTLSVITMALVIALASRGFELAWVVVSTITAWAAFVLIFAVMVIRENGWPVPNVTGLKSYLAFSGPQMPGGVLLWIISSSDRYFITHFLSLSQTGIYSSSYLLASQVHLLYLPITFVLYPLVSELWEKKCLSEVRNYLEYSDRLFLTLAIPASAGIAILSQPILKLLTTSEFLAGWEVVLLVCIGTIFLGIYNINSYIIQLAKQTKFLPLIIAAASVTSVVFNVILIPRIGIMGAAISNIASYCLLAIIVTIWSRKIMAYSLDSKYIGKVVVASLIMSSGVYFMNVNGILGIVLAIIAGGGIFFFALLLMRGFSNRDKQLIRRIFGGLVPRLR